MWVDSHCHLDASEFNGQSLLVADQAIEAGVSAIVIPAVHRNNFTSVMQLAQERETCFYSLGIHPMYVATSKEEDLVFLRSEVERLLYGSANDTDVGKKLIAIGEIGLDFFVPELKHGELREKQEFFYVEQLKIARDFQLPVLLHVRQSQDIILKYLRRINVVGGIAHAFNGSEQQAQHFIQLGFKLGFGGAMTFTRALQIRRLASTLPMASIVLETDAPDISPSWCHPNINTPKELVMIGSVLAQLRGMTNDEVAKQTTMNVLEVLPRMQSTII